MAIKFGEMIPAILLCATRKREKRDRKSSARILRVDRPARKFRSAAKPQPKTGRVRLRRTQINSGSSLFSMEHGKAPSSKLQRSSKSQAPNIQGGALRFIPPKTARSLKILQPTFRDESAYKTKVVRRSLTLPDLAAFSSRWEIRRLASSLICEEGEPSIAVLLRLRRRW